MFKPLAFTKTYSMAAAALLSITLAPILMGFFIRGKMPAEEKNPINRFLIWLYHPVIDFVIKLALGGGHRCAAALIVVGVLPLELTGVPDCLPDGHASRTLGLQSRQALPLPEHRLGIHAAALRGRPALHADHLPRHLADQGAARSSSRPTRSSRRSPRCITSSARSAAPRPPPTPRRWT